MRLRGLSLLLVALCGGVAHAQTTAPLTVERFSPNFSGKGMFGAESADTLEQWKPNVGFLLHYSRDPLRPPLQRTSYLGQRLTGDFVLAIGLFDWLEVGIGVPIVMVNEKGGAAQGAAGGLLGPGPVRGQLKLRFLSEKKNGIGLSVSAAVAAPVGAADAFLTEDGAVFSPAMQLEKHFAKTWRVLINLGYSMRKEARYRNIVMDDEVFWKFGLGWSPTANTEVGFEINGATSVTDMWGRNASMNPLEALFGYRYRWDSGAQFMVGFGPGLNTGAGTPIFRVFTGAMYSPGDKDTDGDGIFDKQDRCPTEPGPRENQGCPWPDRDKDGVPDKDDKCPDEPGPADNQGCPKKEPPKDREGDGVLDADDKCPDVAGPAENKGCPWPDRDKDGVLDKDDKCPDVPGPAENNGCPWPDRDKDGVPDKDDECPDQPGPASNKGCPEKGPIITRTDVKITGRVQFRTNSAAIKNKSSRVILAEVAELLIKYPSLKKVEVAGNTDDIGTDAHNRRLGMRRAKAVVKYLVKKGVAKERLVAKGFGEDKPLVPITKGMSKKARKEARKTNRRVEFHILEKAE